MCILLKRTPRRADTSAFYFMGHADSTAFYFALNVLLMRQIYHDKPIDRGFRLPRPSRVASYTKEYEADITRLWPFLFDFCQSVSKSSHYTFPRSLIIYKRPHAQTLKFKNVSVRVWIGKLCTFQIVSVSPCEKRRNPWEPLTVTGNTKTTILTNMGTPVLVSGRGCWC